MDQEDQDMKEAIARSLRESPDMAHKQGDMAMRPQLSAGPPSQANIDDYDPSQASAFDLEVFKFHNQMRSNPTSFLPNLIEMKLSFNGKVREMEDGTNLMTKEGQDAVQELIDFIKDVDPVPELEWKKELMMASRDHVMDTGPIGILGHAGSDQSLPKDRCERYVKVEGMSGENIDYGEKSAIDVILALAIDDGVPDRGHRTNIFQKGFKKMACFTGDHSVYGK